MRKQISQLDFWRIPFTAFFLVVLIVGFSCSCGSQESEFSSSRQKGPVSGFDPIDENQFFKDRSPKKYKDLVSLFDQRVKAFYTDPRNYFDDGFFLRPQDIIPFTRPDRSASARFPEEISFVVEDFRGHTIAIPSDLSQIVVAPGTDFTRGVAVEKGKEIPLIRHYYLHDIHKDGVSLLFGHLKPNANYCRAFLEMFRITKDNKYLKPAKKILFYLASRLDENGRYSLPFPDNPLQYRAMYQSYILQLVYDYMIISPDRDKNMSSLLDKLVNSYIFTDEGTRDHWLEAKIGEVICARVGQKSYDFSALQKDLNLFYGYIRRFDGKIPFCLNICDPPEFIPNYQVYNTMLLAVLEGKYLKTDLGVKEVFPAIFKVARPDGYWRLFRALYYAKLAFGFDDPEWAELWERKIRASSDFFEIPTLIKYKMISDE